MPACATLREPPSVEISVDEARRRFLVWITGPATGPLVAGRISRIFVERPDLVAYDAFYDLTAYNGDVEASHLDPIVETYARAHPDPELPCRTSFWTYDRHFQLWASAMDQQFPGREHRAFHDLEAALEFLNTPLWSRRRRAP